MNQLLVKYHFIDSQNMSKDGSIKDSASRPMSETESTNQDATVDESVPSSPTSDCVYESLSFLLQCDEILTDDNEQCDQSNEIDNNTIESTDTELTAAVNIELADGRTIEIERERETFVDKSDMLADSEKKKSNPLKRVAKTPMARELYVKRRSSLSHLGMFIDNLTPQPLKLNFWMFEF